MEDNIVIFFQDVKQNKSLSNFGFVNYKLYHNGYSDIQLNQPCKFPHKLFCYSHETHEALPGSAMVKSTLNT